MKLASRRFRVATSNTNIVSELIVQVSRSYGLAVSVEDLSNGIHIQAINKSSWQRIIFSRQLQRVDWRISQDPSGSAISLYYNRSWFNWFRVMVWTLSIPVAMIWCQGFRLLFEYITDPSNTSLVHFIAPWAGIITMMLYSIMVLSVRDSIQYQNEIRCCLRDQGLLLETLPNALLDRITITALIFLVYGVMATTPVFLYGQLPNIDRLTNAQILTITIIVVFLMMLGGALGALFIGVRRLGADERFAALMPSLDGMMAVLFFLGGQMGFQVAGEVNVNHWMSLHALHAASESNIDPSAITHYKNSLSAKTQDALVKLQKLPSMSFGALAGTWALGIGFLIASVRSTRTAQQICRRIQTDIPVTSITAAASASGFLFWFRVFHVIMWFSFVILMLIGTILLVLLSLGALIDLFTHTHETLDPNPISISLFITYTFASQPLRIGMHGFLAVWAMVIPALMVFSILDLKIQVRRRSTRLHQAEKISIQSSDHPFAYLVRDLKKHAEKLQPLLVVTDYPKPLALAHGAILGRDVATFEVSRCTIELLDPNELRALLAHELAHHICGHCRKHEMMLWLGRLTLVGDTFVGALEDSFGYEIEADRVAITQFQISPQDLRNALLKMQVATLLSPTVISTHEKRFDNDTTHTFGRFCNDKFGRIRNSIATWLALYKGDPPLSYWHPSFRDRLALLEEYEKSAEIRRRMNWNSHEK